MDTDEKVRIGYQTAIALIAYEGQVIWRAFTALVGANTGLAVVAGAGIKAFPTFLVGGRLLSGVGIIVCLAWILTLRRQFRYYAYWFAWARHIETTFLKPEVQITTVGKTYGEGGTIEPNENVPKLERFGFLVRIARVEWLMIVVAFAYLLVHAAILWASLSTAGNAP